jgi:hypothetical protein
MSGEGHLQARPDSCAARIPHAQWRHAGQPRLPAVPQVRCPAFIRSSERITATVKHMNAHCTNTGCGHTFLMELSFVHSFNPGLIDRPDLNLKVCPRERSPRPAARKGRDDNQLSMFSG